MTSPAYQQSLQLLSDRRIAVLMGGKSGEREVSLRSGRGCVAALQRHGFDAFAVDPAPLLLQQLAEAGAEVCFNILHGGAGEDGTICAILDYAGIPYTGSGMLASALAMNKHQSKRLFRAAGLPTPEWALVPGDGSNVPELARGLGLPCVVKPVDQGSSLGVSIPKTQEELEDAVAACLASYGEAIVERLIVGTEITVGLLGVGSGLRALPVLELVPHKEFYDYEAKYTKGLTDLICPARIPKQLAERAQALALAAHRELGCLGISRVDMHIDRAGALFIHEVNTVPGMTETSDVPASATAAGMTYDEVVLEILASAATRLAAEPKMAAPSVAGR